MPTRRHDPDICAAVGHRYWTFTVIWCPHRMDWILRRSSYVETGTLSDPVDYRHEELLMGPFDGPADVMGQVAAWVHQPDPSFSQPAPRLPG